MILAWIGAVVVGLSLGLLGSGGSILTVPILVYVAGRDKGAAIPESLAIVALIALVGAVRAGIGGRVVWRAIPAFGGAGMAGAAIGGRIGQTLPGAVQLVMLGVVMLLAAGRMMRSAASRRSEDHEGSEGVQPPVRRSSVWVFASLGVLVGMVTGLVGIGGGFLIVPALTLAAGLEMPRAIGTSLSIIVLTAGTGLVPYLGHEPISWTTVWIFAGFGAAGSLAGQAIGTRLDQRTLRRLFAWFLIGLSVLILARELPGVVRGSSSPGARADGA